MGSIGTMLRGCDRECGVEKRRGDDVERAQEGGRTGQGRDWKGEKEGRMTLRGRIHVRKIVGKGRKVGWKERIAKRDHRERVGMGEGRRREGSKVRDRKKGG